MRPRPGYVLLAALALCIALSAAALAASAEIRMRRTAVRNAGDLTVARSAAASALAHARAILTSTLRDPFALDPWHELHGSAYPVAAAAPANATAMISDLESVRDTVRGTGRVNLNTADEAALLSVPGSSPQLAAAVLRERSNGVRIFSVSQLLGHLSSAERARITAILPALERQLSVETRFVRVHSVARVQPSGMEARAEAVFAREGLMARLVSIQWR